MFIDIRELKANTFGNPTAVRVSYGDISIASPCQVINISLLLT